jgi:type II secretory pathway component PulJ
MPLSDNDVRDAQQRIYNMFMDTVKTFEVIETDHAEMMFGDRAGFIKDAIRECLDDFVRNTNASGETHPEALIYGTSRQDLQRVGFYGVQLTLKEQQVLNANAGLRQRLAQGVRRLWQAPFKKWIDVINNFLGSLVSAAGVGEILKELKDCLRDELPDD